MSEDHTNSNQTKADQTTQNDDAANGPSEAEMMAALKTKAATLGIKHSNNIGVEALRKKINEAMEEPAKTEAQAPAAAAASNATMVAPAEDKPLTQAQIKAQIRRKQQEEQMKLIRCRIYNMNPSKADLHGEIVTVRLKYLGIIKKFVPFGEVTDNGFHLPYCLFKELQNRKFLQVKIKKSRNNAQRLPDTRWAPEFNLEVLPPLTQDELQKMAAHQAAAAGLED